MNATLRLLSAVCLATAVTGVAHAEGAAPASAAPANAMALNNAAIYQASLAALTMLFVVALLLESAFATLFNWRVFLAYFSSRGIKTLVMIAASTVVVVALDIDTVASLMAAYQSSDKDYASFAARVSGPFTKFITALILAGGSAGVNNLMIALGFRDKARIQEVLPTPPSNKAWVAVVVRRVNSVGPLRVKVRDHGPTSGVPNAPAPIAGTVGAPRPSLAEILFRNPDRFPQNGGYPVLPDHVYEITVEGRDANDAPLTALAGERFVFAPGAVLDLRVSL